DGHARQLPERKVPGHDRENGPEWQIRDVCVDRSRLSWFVGDDPGAVLGIPVRFMRAFLDLRFGLGEDLSHFGCDRLRESCLVCSQAVPEVREEAGSFVNRELAKRSKALVGPRDDIVCLRRCEVRECLDLLAIRRVYSYKSCLIHTCAPCRCLLCMR